MRFKSTLTAGLLALLLLVLVSPLSAVRAEAPVVRAVIFYSPSCGHCQKVLTESLPPIVEKYGDQLQIVAINVAIEEGATLFKAGIEAYGQTSSGVPALAIGDHWLVGSVDIPEQLPGLVDGYLRQGGLDWPQVPGLVEALPTTMTQDTANTSTEKGQASNPPAGSHPTGLAATFAQDPAGNTLAVLVLVGMLVILGRSLWMFPRLSRPNKWSRWSWLTPVLALVGLGVAAYLAYVEVTQVEAFCGPVGNCNTVQQSEYARLFGKIPIGVLGLIGYALILAFWLAAHFGRRRAAGWAWLTILGLTTAGLFFSIYLTFLEPFVIGASCAWCLTSAVIMTVLFALSLAPGKIALADIT